MFKEWVMIMKKNSGLLEILRYQIIINNIKPSI